ncbi:cytochrome P450 [Pseudomonas sp. Bout1]|uniref:cytochrome P450 n=1 Tax=Pseudomonas sp. Bout1 TaxID=3048600 RepID=UPI002AB52A59|nr:cytochrome P450 [Pseudomonas sp. Bout1]MDY7534696.1 cytochrome P450 [Pseudomonas sp. Bout1]MEB0186217.1 cytochrome P450 [Pseudomonas sp. Bout1]
MTPLEAATHQDPYDYYARLRRHDELLFDEGLGLWIASTARRVEAVLAHPDCRVRPLHEPVPSSIAGSAAGRVFAALMRMNDGAGHRCPRAIIEPALATVNIADVVAQAIGPVDNLNLFMFTFPVSVIASLLGVPREHLQEVAGLTRDFVACLSPLSSDARLRDANAGASRLREVFSAVLEDTTLRAHIRRRYEASEWQDPEALIANLIGLLSQTCEASAGLIGNTLVALHRRPGLLEEIQRTPTLAGALVEEVARYDSPVQNTRRFVARRCTIGDRILEAGDTVLVLLASANRDPAANPAPDSFLLERTQRRLFSFGAGHHQCPGQHLALNIAAHAIRALLSLQPATLAGSLAFSYWPSLNGRIPCFQTSSKTAVSQTREFCA